MYVARELQENLLRFFKPDSPCGLILNRTVGCGKTTLVNHVLKTLENDFRVFSYTGDDVQFRQVIAWDTRYLHEQISAQTTRPVLIKKVKYGAGEIDFVVSVGQRMIPLEAKTGIARNRIDTALLIDFIRRHDVAFGVVAYGGLPYWDNSNRILYWPYWLI